MSMVTGLSKWMIKNKVGKKVSDIPPSAPDPEEEDDA